MEPFDKHRLDKQVLFFKALSHPTRLWIVRQLRKKDHCVHEFVDLIGDDFSTVSKHLAVLKQARVVTDSKKGTMIFYHLSHPCILSVLECVEETAGE